MLPNFVNELNKSHSDISPSQIVTDEPFDVLTQHHCTFTKYIYGG